MALENEQHLPGSGTGDRGDQLSKGTEVGGPDLGSQDFVWVFADLGEEGSPFSDQLLGSQRPGLKSQLP